MATTDPTDSNFFTDISQLLGKTAQEAGSGRAAQGAYLNQRDALVKGLYDIAQSARTSAANTNLAGDKFKSTLPGIGGQEAIRGALMQNAQPATLDPGTSHMTRMSFTGGTTPASFTPETRAAGAALAKHGSSLINDPSSFVTKTPGSGVAGTDFLQPPALSPEPTAGFWENAAGVGSIASGLAGALSKALGSGGGSSAANALKKLLNGDNSLTPTSTTYSGTPNPENPGTAEPDWWNLMPGANDNPYPVPPDSGGSTSGQAIDPTTGEPLPYGDSSTPYPEDPNAAFPDWASLLPQDGGQ